MDTKDQIVQKLIEYVQKTEDFVIAESPEVIQQAVRYFYVSNLASAIFCSFLMVILISIFFYSLLHPDYDKYESRSLLSIMGMIVPIPFSLGLIVSIAQNIDNLIKICIAPKYFIMNLLLSLGRK